MKRLGLKTRKPKKPVYRPKPYQQATFPGEKVQIDVKFVPTACIVGQAKEQGEKMYQNSLVEVKENVIAELRSLIDSVCQTEKLVEEHDRAEQELRILAERLETLIRENARVAQDQTAYLKQENEIRALYIEKQGNLEKLGKQIAEMERKRNTLEGMIQVVCGIDGEQVEFDEELWGGLLDHIVVKEDGAAVVVFKGGIEIGVDG